MVLLLGSESFIIVSSGAAGGMSTFDLFDSFKICTSFLRTLTLAFPSLLLPSSVISLVNVLLVTSISLLLALGQFLYSYYAKLYSGIIHNFLA